jgi:NAD(P)-dependent dehydrogenase (short-subunit alcohol dehydrogenase family)
MASLSLDDLDESFQVNALAPMALAGRLAPQMVQRGDGVIATVTTSISGGKRDLGAYAGAKAALAAMTQSLRQEIGGKGVAVFAFDPGWVRTRMSPDGKEEPQDAAARLVEHIAAAKSSREVLA